MIEGKGAFDTKELVTSLDSQQNLEDNTPIQAIDEALAVLIANKDAWVVLESALIDEMT